MQQVLIIQLYLYVRKDTAHVLLHIESLISYMRICKKPILLVLKQNIDWYAFCSL